MARDVGTAATHARNADALSKQALADSKGIPSNESTRLLRAQMSSLESGIVQGAGLMLDPAMTVDDNSVQSVRQFAQFADTQAQAVSTAAGTNTCP